MAATTPLSSQFIQADDDDEFDEDAIPAMSYPGGGVPVTPVSASTAASRTPLSANTKGKGRAMPSPVPAAGAPSNSNPSNGVPGNTLAPPGTLNGLSGNIGTSSGTNPSRPNSNRQWVGGVQVETRYTGVDTLDEPVSTTIGRDLLSVYTKLVQVLYPRRTGESRQVLRDWDLWGPLMLCLALGIMLSLNAPENQSLPIFSSVIVIVCLGSVIVTLQTQLLGGKVSFFQALCVLGYCIAPLDIAALISCFVRLIYVRVPVCLLCWAWCVWAAVNFFDGTKIEPNRIILAVYPLLLFYFILAWMILIQ
ncbi:Yip1-domain-containing protein [Serendipita vermifera]|nr:Yip1-domain-containing protein [Serendipita vermifera]